MSSNETDFKILKDKQLDKHTRIKIKKNLMSRRVFVEFKSDKPRMMIEKSFPDSIEGKFQYIAFSNSIKNLDDMKEYFGLSKKENSA
jgi:hypothetical protein